VYAENSFPAVLKRDMAGIIRKRGLLPRCLHNNGSLLYSPPFAGFGARWASRPLCNFPGLAQFACGDRKPGPINGQCSLSLSSSLSPFRLLLRRSRNFRTYERP